MHAVPYTNGVLLDRLYRIRDKLREAKYFPTLLIDGVYLDSVYSKTLRRNVGSFDQHVLNYCRAFDQL